MGGVQVGDIQVGGVQVGGVEVGGVQVGGADVLTLGSDVPHLTSHKVLLTEARYSWCTCVTCRPALTRDPDPRICALTGNVSVLDVC